MAAERTKQEPNPTELSRTNPKIDLEQLKDAERMIAELRQLGVDPPVSSVRSPYGERLTSVRPRPTAEHRGHRDWDGRS